MGELQEMKRLMIFLIVLFLSSFAWAGWNDGIATDPNVAALYRFEDGALTTDQTANNNDLEFYEIWKCSNYAVKHGSYAAHSDNAVAGAISIADASLSSKFPLKNGDTNKKISVCGWFRPNLITNATVLGKYDTYKYSFALSASGTNQNFRINIGYNSGGSWEIKALETITPGAGKWYWFGATYNNSDKSYRLNIYDATADTVRDVNGTTTNNINVEDSSWKIQGENNLMGYMDYVLVFNDILTEAEITDLRTGDKDPSVDSNCVAIWDFEWGTFYEDSKSTNDFVITPVSNTVTYKERLASTDLELSSYNSYGRADSQLSSNFPLKNGTSNNNFSLCYWVNLESISSTYGRTVWCKGSTAYNNGCHTRITSNTTTGVIWYLLLGTTNKNLYCPGLASGKWYWICQRWNNDTGYAYLYIWDDTAQDVFANVTSADWSSFGDPATNNYLFYIGTNTMYSVYCYNFDGLIDEFVVWNKVLTDDEMSSIIAGTYAGTTPPADTGVGGRVMKLILN